MPTPTSSQEFEPDPVRAFPAALLVFFVSLVFQKACSLAFDSKQGVVYSFAFDTIMTVTAIVIAIEVTRRLAADGFSRLKVGLLLLCIFYLLPFAQAVRIVDTPITNIWARIAYYALTVVGSIIAFRFIFIRSYPEQPASRE